MQNVGYPTKIRDLPSFLNAEQQNPLLGKKIALEFAPLNKLREKPPELLVGVVGTNL